MCTSGTALAFRNTSPTRRKVNDIVETIPSRTAQDERHICGGSADRRAAHRPRRSKGSGGRWPCRRGEIFQQRRLSADREKAWDQGDLRGDELAHQSAENER